MAFDVEAFEAYRWLGWAVDHAREWAPTDAELLARLDRRFSGSVRETSLREIERRATVWDETQLAALAASLGSLEASHREGGRSSQDVDRLLQRLLHLAPSGRSLAETCLASDRRQRRRAALRYFSEHGFGTAVATTLSSQVAEEFTPELLRLAIEHPHLLEVVPLGSLLAQVDAFYWRGRVFEALLRAHIDDPVLLVAEEWPAEFIFGVRRAGRREFLGEIDRLVIAHSDDAETLTGAIQAFGVFGRTRSMLQAVALGDELLRGASSGHPQRGAA